MNAIVIETDSISKKRAPEDLYNDYCDDFGENSFGTLTYCLYSMEYGLVNTDDNLDRECVGRWRKIEPKFTDISSGTGLSREIYYSTETSRESRTLVQCEPIVKQTIDARNIKVNTYATYILGEGVIVSVDEDMLIIFADNIGFVVHFGLEEIDNDTVDFRDVFRPLQPVKFKALCSYYTRLISFVAVSVTIIRELRVKQLYISTNARIKIIENHVVAETKRGDVVVLLQSDLSLLSLGTGFKEGDFVSIAYHRIMDKEGPLLIALFLTQDQYFEDILMDIASTKMFDALYADGQSKNKEERNYRKICRLQANDQFPNAWNPDRDGMEWLRDLRAIQNINTVVSNSMTSSQNLNTANNSSALTICEKSMDSTTGPLLTDFNADISDGPLTSEDEKPSSNNSSGDDYKSDSEEVVSQALTVKRTSTPYNELDGPLSSFDVSRVSRCSSMAIPSPVEEPVTMLTSPGNEVHEKSRVDRMIGSDYHAIMLAELTEELNNAPELEAKFNSLKGDDGSSLPPSRQTVLSDDSSRRTSGASSVSKTGEGDLVAGAQGSELSDNQPTISGSLENSTLVEAHINPSTSIPDEWVAIDIDMEDADSPESRDIRNQLRAIHSKPELTSMLADPDGLVEDMLDVALFDGLPKQLGVDDYRMLGLSSDIYEDADRHTKRVLFEARLLDLLQKTMKTLD